ncbi:MAG TPA: histidine kinase, partial [Ferruginibacter sp.]|nr:histidine kinase [Ferruginibacter sp.]
MYILLCVIIIFPLIFYNLWLNEISKVFYPPFVVDPSSVKNKWEYYIYFYSLRGLIIGLSVYLIQYREDLVEEKQEVRLINEKLVQQNLLIQLEVLKQQISPHFLFNTLNSLKALIGTNPAQAEIYTVELSKVYRYLLNHRKADSVSLSEEIGFLTSYIALLKLRFESNFSVEITINSRYNLHKL